MKVVKLVIVVLLGILVSACGQEESADIRPISVLTLKVSYIDDETMSILSTLADPLTSIVFPLIPGALGGGVSDENLIVEQVGEDREITIQLNTGIFTHNTYPTLIAPSLLASGVSITPSDTNFGRLGQFDEYELYGDTGPYVLFDNINKFYFALVYFDRAASLTGLITENGFTAALAMHVPEEGFYAFRTEETATEAIVRVTNLSNDVHFAYLRNYGTRISENRPEFLLGR